MSHRFDDLTKALANTRSRRGVLKLMGAGALGSLFTGIFAGGASANSRLNATLCSFGCARVGPNNYRECVATCVECSTNGQALGFTFANDSLDFFCCPEGTFFNRLRGVCEQSCLTFCKDASRADSPNFQECFDTCRGCQSEGVQAAWSTGNETTFFYCCPPGTYFDESTEECLTDNEVPT